MAFKLSKSNNFKTKVEVITPTDSGEAKWSFTAEFRIMTAEESAKEDFFETALVSVEGVPVEDGISQTDVLEILKSRPDTRNAIIKAYNAAVVKKNQPNSLF